MKPAHIVKRLQDLEEVEGKVRKAGKYSGSVFSHDEELVRLNKEASNLFLFSDLSQPQLHIYSKQLENEIVAMKLDLFKGDSRCCGIATTGGSESLELAVLAHARHYRRKKGISQPEIVVCETVHAAVYKACDFFDIKCVKVKVDRQFKVNIKAMKAAINNNTVCVFVSAPNYPFGYCDPLQDLASFVNKLDIGLHIDMCMGGFLIPFAKEHGYVLEEPEYNFSVPGVTSISSDPHKYGLTCKGISVILFRDHEIQKSLYFSNVEGPLYVNPGITDGKSAGVVAACWATMMYYGRDGYSKLAKSTFEMTKEFCEQVKKIKGLSVIGEPVVSKG